MRRSPYVTARDTARTLTIVDRGWQGEVGDALQRWEGQHLDGAVVVADEKVGAARAGRAADVDAVIDGPADVQGREPACTTEATHEATIQRRRKAGEGRREKEGGRKKSGERRREKEGGRKKAVPWAWSAKAVPKAMEGSSMGHRGQFQGRLPFLQSVLDDELTTVRSKSDIAVSVHEPASGPARRSAARRESQAGMPAAPVPLQRMHVRGGQAGRRKAELANDRRCLRRVQLRAVQRLPGHRQHLGPARRALDQVAQLPVFVRVCTLRGLRA